LEFDEKETFLEMQEKFQSLQIISFKFKMQPFSKRGHFEDEKDYPVHWFPTANTMRGEGTPKTGEGESNSKTHV